MLISKTPDEAQAQPSCPAEHSSTALAALHYNPTCISWQSISLPAYDPRIWQEIFRRSYTVRSTIGYWHDRPNVVHLSVTLCNVALRVSVWGWKL